MLARWPFRRETARAMFYAALACVVRACPDGSRSSSLAANVVVAYYLLIAVVLIVLARRVARDDS